MNEVTLVIFKQLLNLNILLLYVNDINFIYNFQFYSVSPTTFVVLFVEFKLKLAHLFIILS